VSAFEERHLHAVLTVYVANCNSLRCHLSLAGNLPLPRDIAPEPAAEVLATPVLGGLHHIYERAA